MNKNIYFIMGLVLAGIGAAGFWALNAKSPAPEPDNKQTRKVSLLTINYIPTSPTKPIYEEKFWHADSEAATEATEISLKEFSGKPVILHFWATWCAPCLQELPHLDAFAKKHGDTAHIIAVATDVKDIEKIRSFYKSKGIKNLKIAYDKKGVLAQSFRTPLLPTTVFINSQGHEIGRIQGIVEWDGKAGRLLNSHLSRN